MTQIILFNKPYGVLCQFTGGAGRTTLADYIPIKNIYPAGRLDQDSEGLLVLSDDGRLQHRIADPRHKLAKHYRVQVEGEPDQDALSRLRTGVPLKDGLSAPAEAELLASPVIWPRTPPIRSRARIPTAWINLILREGWNRQIRRMTAAVGYPTLRLIRHRAGAWELGDPVPGEYRILTYREDHRLR